MVKTNDEPKPVFDFSQTSYKWLRQWSNVNNRIMQYSTLLTANENPDNTPDQQDELRRARLEAAAGFDGIIDERDALVVQALTDVPRDWLITGAPEGINWHDQASLDYLRADRIDDLVNALTEARSAAQKK
jgi:hypothetical protein